MEEKMLKFDMHCHTSGVSHCGRKNYIEIINDKIAEGYQGMVLTNHIDPSYYNNTNEYHQEMRKQIDEFYAAKNYGESKGFKVIFGIEVSLHNPIFAHILLYGIDENFLQNSTILCDFDLKGLFDLCNKHHIFMIQAHPFRTWNTPGDIDYLHGMEINSNTDLDFVDEVLKMNKDKNKILTVGTDYHGIKTTPGGLYLPEGVNDSKDLYNYLLKRKTIKYFIDDKDYTFTRQ